MGLKTLRWAVLGILVLTGVALSMIQRDTVTVPMWSIQFVDQLNRPLVGLKVMQSWQNYSLEDDGHHAFGTTDERGIAIFPERRLRTSKLRQVVGPLMSFLFGGGIHASYGPDSSLWPACGLDDKDTAIIVMRDGDLPTRSVLKYLGGNLRRPECVKLEAQVREADRLAAPR
jgi:hypothetical protein